MSVVSLRMEGLNCGNLFSFIFNQSEFIIQISWRDKKNFKESNLIQAIKFIFDRFENKQTHEFWNIAKWKSVLKKSKTDFFKNYIKQKSYCINAQIKQQNFAVLQQLIFC